MNLRQPSSSRLGECCNHPASQSRLESRTVTGGAHAAGPPPDDGTPACGAKLGTLFSQVQHAVAIRYRHQHVDGRQIRNRPRLEDVDSQGPLRYTRQNSSSRIASPVTKLDRLAVPDSKNASMLRGLVTERH
jgi:hypothetical protein